jgi:hypothetical protein
MRWRILVLPLLLSTTGGCTSFWEDTVRNVVEIPIRKADDGLITCRCRRLAREAWKKLVLCQPNQHYSNDYAKGFQDGYAEYLDLGGNCQPPALPPFCYRQSRYETPAGHQAIEEWYEGYNHGALAARESGQRELIVIPLSAPPINVLTDRRPPEQPLSPAQLTAPGDSGPGPASPPEELPSPRPIASTKMAPPPSAMASPPSTASP